MCCAGFEYWSELIKWIPFKEIDFNELVRLQPSSDLEIVLETFSDTEENELCDKTSSLNIESPVNNEDNSDLNEGSEIRKLLRLKDELERRHKMQESHKQKYQVSNVQMCEIIQQMNFIML